MLYKFNVKSAATLWRRNHDSPRGTGTGTGGRPTDACLHSRPELLSGSGLPLLLYVRGHAEAEGGRVELANPEVAECSYLIRNERWKRI